MTDNPTADDVPLVDMLWQALEERIFFIRWKVDGMTTEQARFPAKTEIQQFKMTALSRTSPPPVAEVEKCPSCGGLNTSCPDGCGRDPETGELNGTRLEPSDDFTLAAYEILGHEPWHLAMIDHALRRGAEIGAARERERCKTAVRDCMVYQEWPPQDGDVQIDEVLAAIDALSTPNASNGEG